MRCYWNAIFNIRIQYTPTFCNCTISRGGRRKRRGHNTESRECAAHVLPGRCCYIYITGPLALVASCPCVLYSVFGFWVFSFQCVRSQLPRPLSGLYAHCSEPTRCPLLAVHAAVGVCTTIVIHLSVTCHVETTLVWRLALGAWRLTVILDFKVNLGTVVCSLQSTEYQGRDVCIYRKYSTALKKPGALITVASVLRSSKSSMISP
jgi:hypothetical protein